MMAPFPLIVIEPLPPTNVPLLVQFPPIVWLKGFPFSVVAVPSDTFPFTVRAPPAVNESELPAPAALVRFPAMVSAAAGIVFVTAPPLVLRTKLP